MLHASEMDDLPRLTSYLQVVQESFVEHTRIPPAARLATRGTTFGGTPSVLSCWRMRCTH